jgi:hypothetical protein
MAACYRAGWALPRALQKSVVRPHDWAVKAHSQVLTATGHYLTDWQVPVPVKSARRERTAHYQRQVVNAAGHFLTVRQAVTSRLPVTVRLTGRCPTATARSLQTIATPQRTGWGFSQFGAKKCMKCGMPRAQVRIIGCSQLAHFINLRTGQRATSLPGMAGMAVPAR